MQDMDWKTWALVIALVLGAGFEFFKLLPNRGAAWESESLHLAGESQPYSVKNIERENARLRPRPLPAHTGVTRGQLEKFLAANHPQQTEFDHPKDKGAEGKVDGKKKAEKCDEKHPKFDPKTGRKIACKKKKKDKKKDIAKTDEAPKYDTDHDQDHDQDSDINSALTEAAATGQIPQPLSDKPDDAFDSLENWESRLLSQPDLAETKRFIDHHQKNLVTDEIFYKITALMLNDSRPQMKLLGVMCAGLTPSALSFQMLAQTINSERSDSDVRKQAENFVSQTYSSLANLGILEGVLRSSSVSYATVLAAKRLNAIATQYLSPGATGTSKDPVQTSGNVSKNAAYFQRFIGILQGLTGSADASVSEQSRLTLANLQSLLSGISTAAVTPPTQAT
jgi:hypothetical protein